jgi:4-amino-4-deoxy-L-arabinose transferase-like glycosyltransferase
VHTTDLVLAAAAAALLATGLAHLLLLSTPRPLTFLGWIIGLATVLAVLLPFSTTAPLDAKVATAAVDLVLGIAIGSLVSGVAARSVRIAPSDSAGYLVTDPVYDERRSLPGRLR